MLMSGLKHSTELNRVSRPSSILDCWMCSNSPARTGCTNVSVCRSFRVGGTPGGDDSGSIRENSAYQKYTGRYPDSALSSWWVAAVVSAIRDDVGVLLLACSSPCTSENTRPNTLPPSDQPHCSPG